MTSYKVLEVISIRGEIPYLVKGPNFVRVESLKEVELDRSNPQCNTFRGVTQHLQYTTGAQRQELDKHSHSEIPPSDKTIAVLIPIRKSRQWWGLSQDQRQAHFQTTRNEGHTAIGLRYADRVYRRLYHSRYLDSSANYDFLTYFEFYDRYADDFRRLLAELRDATRNPEWNYVDLEIEIWMNKMS